MTDETRLRVFSGGVSIAVTDRGGEGPPVLLLHDLAGSSREMLPTAGALKDFFLASAVCSPASRWGHTRWGDGHAAFQAPALAVFAEHGMFSATHQDELFRRRPATKRVDVRGGSHDAHLGALVEWVDVFGGWLEDVVTRAHSSL